MGTVLILDRACRTVLQLICDGLNTDACPEFVLRKDRRIVATDLGIPCALSMRTKNSLRGRGGYPGPSDARLVHGSVGAAIVVWLGDRGGQAALG